MAALDVPGWLVSGSSNVLRTRIQRLRIIQQSSDCLLQYWQVLLDNSPNYDLVERVHSGNPVPRDADVHVADPREAKGRYGLSSRATF